MQSVRGLLEGKNYENQLVLNEKSREEIQWWIQSLKSSNGRSLKTKKREIQITSDASNKGWGAWSGQEKIGGFWTSEEEKWHINAKELKAGLMAVKTFVKSMKEAHVTLSMDNVTTVSQINRKSSPTSELLLELSKESWEVCLVRGSSLLTRETESDRGFSVQGVARFQRLEAEQESFFPTSRESEGNGGRSVCNPYEHSITQVCQLEGRSGGHGNGQPAVMLVGHQGICVPTILLDRESVTQNVEGGGDNRPYYPDMAGANVVSDVFELLYNFNE